MSWKWSEPYHYSFWQGTGTPLDVTNTHTILHPDTLLPMDLKRLEEIGRSRGTVPWGVDESWSLGITLSKDGVVGNIGDGTPASRARLVFESKVT